MATKLPPAKDGEENDGKNGRDDTLPRGDNKEARGGNPTHGKRLRVAAGAGRGSPRGHPHEMVCGTKTPRRKTPHKAYPRRTAKRACGDGLMRFPWL